MRRKAPWGSTVRGTMPGDNESCFSQTPSCQDPSRLRGVFAPKGKVLRQISQGGTKQDDWPEGRQRPGKLPPYKEFKLPKGATLSLSLPLVFPHVPCFSNKFLLFSLTSSSSLEFFFFDKTGKNWGSRP